MRYAADTNGMGCILRNVGIGDKAVHQLQAARIGMMVHKPGLNTGGGKIGPPRREVEPDQLSLQAACLVNGSAEAYGELFLLKGQIIRIDDEITVSV